MNFSRRVPLDINDPLLSALHHFAESTLDSKYHGRFDASALLCTALMTESLIESLLPKDLPQVSSVPKELVDILKCMSCKRRFSETARVIDGVLHERRNQCYHRMYIDALHDHRVVIFCEPCSRRLKIHFTYCPQCLTVPKYTLRKPKSNLTQAAQTMYQCRTCNKPCVLLSKDDPALSAMRKRLVEPKDLFDGKLPEKSSITDAS